jgi:hypothetical protein
LLRLWHAVPGKVIIPPYAFGTYSAKKQAHLGTLRVSVVLKESFVVWCWCKRGLAVNTIRTYLGELKNLERLAKGLANEGFDMENVLLRGIQNLRSSGTRFPTPTLPISIELLQVIRKNMAGEKEKLTGQLVWNYGLVAFWGAFRLGELLGKSERCFDKFSDLLWEDATWDEEKIVLKIKSAKVKGAPGKRAILFKIPDQSLCPMVALKRLQASQVNLGLWEMHLPIFRKSNGLFLRKTEFLGWVNRARGEGTEMLSGKSFQSALPSALQNFPTSFQESHLKALGR